MHVAPQIYIDTAEAARLIGLSPGTLAKWRLSGYGPIFAKLGRRVIYRKADIDEWLADKRHSSTSEYATANHGAGS